MQCTTHIEHIAIIILLCITCLTSRDVTVWTGVWLKKTSVEAYELMTVNNYFIYFKMLTRVKSLNRLPREYCLPSFWAVVVLGGNIVASACCAANS